MYFQPLIWLGEDSGNEWGEDIEYKIRIFGRDSEGVCKDLTITKCPLYFYIMIPSNKWKNSDIKMLCEYIKSIYGDGITNIKLVKGIPLYPFTNNEMRRYLRIDFIRKITFYSLRKMLKNPLDISLNVPRGYIFKTCESILDPILRLGHVQDIRTAGWIEIDDDNDVIECESSMLKSYRTENGDEYPKFAPFIIMSWDIEAYSSLGYPNLPDSMLDGDYISQIGVTIWIFGGDTKKYIFNWFKSENINKDVVEFLYSSEKEMLKGFCEWVKKEDPDIITGYNTWGFDDNYLFNRMKKHNILEDLDLLSRIDDKQVNIVDKVLSSSAYGHNEFRILNIPGRMSFDMLVCIRKDHKLQKYSLNSVSEHFLNDCKDDIGAEELFSILEIGNPKDIGRVCNYCVQDTYLVIKLMDKLCIITNFVEMAKSTRVPMDWLLVRGQQCKVYSQLLYETRKLNYIVTDREEPPLTYKGATVLTAKSGAFFDPVIALDFKSLYPSIMIDYNMCYSTIVTEDKYMNLDGINYKKVEWEEELDICTNQECLGNCLYCKGERIKKFSYTYVQSIPGILPGILSRLWDERNMAKKKMKKNRGTFLEKVYDGQQLAIKVTMNSIYGFCGADKGMQSCKPIAASVTAKGREMIDETSTIAQELTNCITVYGDSVTAETSIMVKINNLINFIAIEDFSTLWTEYRGFKINDKTINSKEQSLPLPGLQVWDGKNWTYVKRIIRHKTQKKIYRILTHTSCVEVTEDHSLINEEGQYIKPGEIKINDRLYCSYPINRDINILKESKIYDMYDNQINCSIKYYELKCKGKCVSLKYRKDLKKYVLNIDDYKKITNEIVSIEEITKDYTNEYVYDIETESGHFQAGIGDIIVKNTDSCYIKPILNANNFENHEEYMKEIFNIGNNVAKNITEYYKDQYIGTRKEGGKRELEMEKVMYPLLLFSKKRYAFQEWLNCIKPSNELEIKGVSVKRRDFCKYVKDTGIKILEIILKEKDIDGAIIYTKKRINDLLNGNVPINELVISKSLNNTYKVDGIKIKWDNEKIQITSQPHVNIARKLKKMKHTVKPPQRIPYVFINTNKKSALQCDRTEHPDYLDGKSIDSLYYFDSQMKNTILFIFELLVKNPEDLYKEEYINKSNIDKKQSTIKNFVCKQKQNTTKKIILKEDKASLQSVSSSIKSEKQLNITNFFK